MFLIKEKVYITSDNGIKKAGRVISEPTFRDGKMSYLCDFNGTCAYVEHDKLNKLNFKILNGGK